MVLESVFQVILEFADLGSCFALCINKALPFGLDLVANPGAIIVCGFFELLPKLVLLLNKPILGLLELFSDLLKFFRRIQLNRHVRAFRAFRAFRRIVTALQGGRRGVGTLAADFTAGWLLGIGLYLCGGLG